MFYLIKKFKYPSMGVLTDIYISKKVSLEQNRCTGTLFFASKFHEALTKSDHAKTVQYQILLLKIPTALA